MPSSIVMNCLDLGSGMEAILVIESGRVLHRLSTGDINSELEFHTQSGNKLESCYDGTALATELISDGEIQIVLVCTCEHYRGQVKVILNL